MTPERLVELLERNGHAVVGGWAADVRGAAFLLGVSEKTLQNWRAAGTGPRAMMFGRWCYDLRDLAGWITSRTQEHISTAETGKDRQMPADGARPAVRKRAA